MLWYNTCFHCWPLCFTAALNLSTTSIVSASALSLTSAGGTSELHKSRTSLCRTVYIHYKRFTHRDRGELDHSANHIPVSALNPLWLAKTTTRGRKVNMATLRVQALTCPQRHQQLLREKTTLHYRIILYINIMCFFVAKNNYCCSYAWSASQVGAFVAGSCNPDNASILIKGLIKHFLLLNEYLISQRVSAAANCGETQRTN